MKKCNILGITGKILLVVGIALIIASICQLVYVFKYRYTQKDIDRVVDIFLEKVEPTKQDYKRYDLDNNGELTLYDLVLVCKRVK